MASAAAWPVRRELQSLTAHAEKRALVWMAERLPRRIEPDHLTALGLAGHAAAGLCYALSASEPAFLLAVNLALAVNWLGDSLDGTLARVRKSERPRYGFYVDHMVDALGALLLVGGLALSGLVHPWLALALLVLYQLVTIHIALATCATGTFRMAFGGIGGTELRLALCLLNAVAWLAPTLGRVGLAVRTFDVAVGTLLVALSCFLATASARTARDLGRQERRAA
jgi:phosphatidylglycerophosphate synthase